MLEEQLQKSFEIKSPQFLILSLHDVPFIDSSGDEYLCKMMRELRRNGGTLLIAGARENVLQSMKKSGLLQKVGLKHSFETVEQALAFASSQIKPIPA